MLETHHTESPDELVFEDHVPNVQFELEVNHRGIKVLVQGKTAVDSPYPPLVLVHDFGANLGHYQHFMHELFHAGFSVYSYDLRGHGQSATPGHFSYFGDLVKDLLQIAAWIRHREGGQTPVLIGHGFGCLIAMTLQQRFPKFCKGMVLLSPSIKLKFSLGKLASVMVRGLADLHPRIPLPAALTPRYYTLLNNKDLRSEEIIKQKRATITRISAQTGKQILNALETAQSRFLRIKAPALVITGEKDPIVDYSVLPDLIKRHKRGELLTLFTLPGASHNLITENEPFAQQICDEICQWMSQIPAGEKA